MLRIATRSSALALAQARQVAEMLGGAELVVASSDGEPGDKARFVRGVERALLEGEAEIGVHSAKDLPAELPEGLEIAAVPPREDPADAWIGAGASLDDVPAGARIGTASLRRRAQLLAARPDLEVVELHGNVDTRLGKLAAGDLDAIVLAVAGLRRLGREDEVSFAIPAESMTPAAGQGALVLQIRGDDEAAAAAVAPLGNEAALRELTVERAVVSLLNATCATPIGVRAEVKGDRILAAAFVGLPDGSEWIRDRLEGNAAEPALLGAELAERLLGVGAREILDRAEGWHSSAT
ncbi:MAG TPA: hydroxymethylbilane synthase [Solirubrobacterales bacterium]|nr:hydroxymethylbilane synthase [Solirubrobacterales bacterium]